MANDWVKKWRVRKNDASDYVISIARDGTFGCSCPAWTLQRKECRHIKMVKGTIPKSDYDITVVFDSTKQGEPLVELSEAEADHLFGNSGVVKNIAKALTGVKEPPSPPSIMDLIRKNAQYGGLK